MKSLKQFKQNQISKDQSVKIKGGGADGQMGIFCEWYVGFTGNSNMPAVHSDTNPGVHNSLAGQ